MKALRARMISLGILLGAITAGKIADRCLRPWVGWVWWIPILLTVAFVLVLSSVFSEMEEELSARYPAEKIKQKADE